MSDYYGTTSGATAYHSDRGDTAWGEASEYDRMTALRRASQYLDTHYTFAGEAATSDQIREWPRSGVTYRGETLASDVTPTAVEHAVYEAALREIKAPGSLAPDFTNSGAIKREKKGVGPLMKEIEYTTAGSAYAVKPVIAMIDGLLRPLLKAGRGSVNFPVIRG